MSHQYIANYTWESRGIQDNNKLRFYVLVYTPLPGPFSSQRSPQASCMQKLGNVVVVTEKLTNAFFCDRKVDHI